MPLLARDPMMNIILREWATKQDYYMTKQYGPISDEVVNAWLAVQTQKPFVFSSMVTKDKRRIISLLCTRCADIHHIVVPVGVLSDGSKRIMALCAKEYNTEDTYEYVDWGILDKDHEKKVPVYDY